MPKFDAHVADYYRYRYIQSSLDQWASPPADADGKRLHIHARLAANAEAGRTVYEVAAEEMLSEEPGPAEEEDFVELVARMSKKPERRPPPQPRVRLLEKDAPAIVGTGENSETRRMLLSRLKHEAELRGPSGQDEADALFADLHAAAPWMEQASMALWQEARVHAREGRGLKLRPTLIAGPRGCGKTTYVQLLAEKSGVPFLRIDASIGLVSFAIAGVEAGWRSAKPGMVLEAMAAHRCANPIVLVDEVDKAPSSANASTLDQALLPLLERVTASTWRCPFLGLPVDMSHVNWLLSANDVGAVNPVLRDRVRVIQASYPVGEKLEAFIRASAPETVEKSALEALVERSLAAAAQGKPITLRRIMAALDAASKAADKPMLN